MYVYIFSGSPGRAYTSHVHTPSMRTYIKSKHNYICIHIHTDAYKSYLKFSPKQ